MYRRPSTRWCEFFGSLHTIDLMHKFQHSFHMKTTLAMRELGIALSSGWGATKDERLAAAWLRRSSDAGDAAGMNAYADRLEQGEGVAKNADEALRLYRKAAELGNLNAKSTLCWRGEPGYGQEGNRPYTSKEQFARDARSLGMPWIVIVPDAMKRGRRGLEILKQAEVSRETVEKAAAAGVSYELMVSIAMRTLLSKGANLGYTFK